MAEKLTRLEQTITSETIFDLANWLTQNQSYTSNQLEKLQDEKFYLPLISLANNFWLIGALTHQLKEKRVWSLLPKALTRYLIEIDNVYLERSQAIYQEAIFCCKTLKNAQIDVVMLKGIAGLFNGSYKNVSERFMVDIDLLVKENQLQESIILLKRTGYAEQEEEFDIHAVEHHHAPPLIRNNGCCFIELHRSGLKKPISGVLSTEETWQDSFPLTLNDNLQVLQLSPTHQFILAIAHSELSNKHFDYKTFDLRQIHNIYIIASYFYQEIHWDKVQEHFARDKKSHMLNSMLVSIHQLFNFSTPITSINDEHAIKHFTVIIKNYLATQGRMTVFSRILRILHGYRKESILHYYGRNGFCAVGFGRFKHFKRHCKMLYKTIFKPPEKNR